MGGDTKKPKQLKYKKNLTVLQNFLIKNQANKK